MVRDNELYHLHIFNVQENYFASIHLCLKNEMINWSLFYANDPNKRQTGTKSVIKKDRFITHCSKEKHTPLENMEYPNKRMFKRIGYWSNTLVEWLGKRPKDVSLL